MAFSFPNATWSSATTYAINNLADYQGTDYISLANGNINNIPTSTLGTKWNLYTDWSAGTTYNAPGTDKVTYNGLGYVSLVAGNLNNIPSSTVGTKWQRLVVNSPQGAQPHAAGIKFFRNAGPLPAPLDGNATKYLDGVSPGVPGLQTGIGLIFYRNFIGNPQQSPGPSSVWQGRTVFRVPRTMWYTGLQQRANKPPVMHNSGE